MEEVVASCRGKERVELLRQLLISLKGTERTHGNLEEATSLEQPQPLESKKTLLVSIYQWTGWQVLMNCFKQLVKDGC